LDWLLFKSGIRKPTRLRTKGKNQAGEEGNTTDLRWLPPLLRHPGTLNQIRNSEYKKSGVRRRPYFTAFVHSHSVFLYSVLYDSE
jgi:hypothetical protein